MPGDLKFEDYNGDGIIDDNDTQPLGHGATPRMYYGLNMSGEYKGFDLTVFFQGAAGHDIYVSGDILDPFIQQGLGNGLAIMTDRWHRKTRPTLIANGFRDICLPHAWQVSPITVPVTRGHCTTQVTCA